MNKMTPWIIATLLGITMSTIAVAKTFSTQLDDNNGVDNGMSGENTIDINTLDDNDYPMEAGVAYPLHEEPPLLLSSSNRHSSYKNYKTHKYQSYGKSGGYRDRYYRYPYSGYINFGYQHYYPGYPTYNYGDASYRYRAYPYSVYNSPYYYRQRDFYYPGYFGLSIPFESFTGGGDYNTTDWVWSSMGNRPHGAVVGGKIHGQHFYICQANYKNGRYTGKLYNKGCHIDVNGQNVLMRRYQVLVDVN